MRRDELSNLIDRQIALTGDTWHLKFRRGDRDVRIETGSRRGDQVHRHRHIRVFRLQCSRILLDAGDQNFVRGTKIRSRPNLPHRSQCLPLKAANGSSPGR